MNSKIITIERYANKYNESNLVWWNNDNLKKFIFFADADISWYCYDSIENYFCELDKPSGELVEKFIDYNQMMDSALQTIIDH